MEVLEIVELLPDPPHLAAHVRSGVPERAAQGRHARPPVVIRRRRSPPEKCLCLIELGETLWPCIISDCNVLL